MNRRDSDLQIVVVIPAFRVRRQILGVCQDIPDLVSKIYVVDDACPEGSGDLVEAALVDPRVCVLRHSSNQGVGGAVMTGYLAAMRDGADIIVKIDGDGQMDTQLIADFIEPIVTGEADYTKGNRFYNLDTIKAMPRVRILGNAILSLLTKLSAGYWNLFDPTNGYTAIHSDVCRRLPLHKVSKRYFFETDMLFRLNTVRAVVIDIPMDAKYGEETSNLKISKIIGEFFIKHLRNLAKRVAYNYFLRDLSLASLELLVGLLMLTFGLFYGGYHWAHSASLGIPTAAGTVMVAAMPVLVGIQLILSFIGYDIASVPKRPLHRRRRINQSRDSIAPN